MGTLYTIGHSTRTMRQLVALFRAYGVEQVVDLRTIPRSRPNPQFNRPARSRALTRRQDALSAPEGAGWVPSRASHFRPRVFVRASRAR